MTTPTALASLAVGAQGVISVIGNAYPKLFSEIIRLGLADKFTEAHTLNKKIQDVHQWLYAEGNPAGIKAAMEHLGFCSRQVRLPLAEMSETVMTKLIEAMAEVD